MGNEKATDAYDGRRYDGLYARTPSQAEGERDDAAERGRAAETHPDTPRTQPSQAEGERGD
ncbi:hypothetical protein OG909_18805 [Streptomyces sp. NBC_01754]|uniref:hypothetical protein n=1 Tax=Streptomyces sp. NBC_01754 TaxID=2975930 RepID=UPI002DDC533B|nr:hypothetical protein [Streptomyces sp. NBC_01754]WSC97065.1 hypothetical protein OG909_18805 [Streptomyces sp. NBC_01754]